MKKWPFKPIDRNTSDLFPASVQEYLPEDHLARFVVEVVDQLDIDVFIQAYRGVGSKAWHPAMMLSLLFYGYATGVFSSRKLKKRATIPLRFVTSVPTSIQIITAATAFVSASGVRSAASSFRFGKLLRQRVGSSWVMSVWMVRRSKRMPANIRR